MVQHKLHTRKKTQLLAALLALSSFGAIAQTPYWLSIRGFGSLIHDTTDDAVSGYRGYPQASTLTKADQWSLQHDSRVAVQFDIASQSDLSATVQMMGRWGVDGNFSFAPEWAFLKYKINPNLSVRVGRIVTPALMESEYRFVGYANVFVRPESNFYALYPLSKHDGVDITYQMPLADGTLTMVATTGKTEIDRGTDFISGPGLVGLAGTWESDTLTVRASHFKIPAKITGPAGTVAQLKGLQAAAAGVPAAACPSCAHLANSLANTLDDFNYQISNIGARSVIDSWTVWGEYGKVTAKEAIIAPGSSWMLGVSRSLGTVTPYVTYSDFSQSRENVNQLVPAAVSAQLAAASRAVVGWRNNSRTGLALGARWDAMKNVALKGEVQRIKFDAPEANPVQFPRFPAFSATVTTRPTSFNLYSIALDFVF